MKRLIRQLPWILLALEALLLGLGWLSMGWLDNGSGNWGGANGIFFCLVALPGILLLRVLGGFALASLDWAAGWMTALTVLTNLALAFGLGSVVRGVLDKP